MHKLPPESRTILVFDYERAMNETTSISHESTGRGRIHAVYRFYDATGGYICEVRYGAGQPPMLFNVDCGHIQKTG